MKVINCTKEKSSNSCTIFIYIYWISAVDRVYCTGRIPGREFYADVYKQKPMKITQKVFVPVKQYPKVIEGEKIKKRLILYSLNACSSISLVKFWDLKAILCVVYKTKRNARLRSKDAARYATVVRRNSCAILVIRAMLICRRICFSKWALWLRLLSAMLVLPMHWPRSVSI